jgi:hypothetical protein
MNRGLDRKQHDRLSVTTPLAPSTYTSPDRGSSMNRGLDRKKHDRSSVNHALRWTDRAPLRFAVLLAVLAFAGQALLAQANARKTPKFYPDDPITTDDDTAMDAAGFEEVELSEAWDFVINTFTSPGDRRPIRAVNVNTMDEVPNSSWFENRIGVRDLPIPEIVRGPLKFEGLDVAEWTIVRGKSPGGFQPGFRASHTGDPGQVYQLEVDPPKHPQMASGAEFIGTLIYHTLGYHVVDVYTIKLDPTKLMISDGATIRDASGERKFTRDDLDEILRVAGRDSQGRVTMSATRLEEGSNRGRWEYFGTRSDDPNDIHPHEHRRELRANRVFSAWLAHDDSRAVNTRNILMRMDNRRVVRHYMYDFGATLGSATRFAEPAANNHEYFLDDGAPALKSLFSLGLAVPKYLKNRPSNLPPAVGAIDSESFDPALWRPNYPNPAFDLMQPDDAFWGARLVSRFSDEIIRAIVGAARFDDPAATDYLSKVLSERRDKVVRAWINGVMPIVKPALAADGTLTFENAAVTAGAAEGGSYVVTWARFNNDSGETSTVGSETPFTGVRTQAPSDVLTGSDYIVATIRGEHPQHAGWRRPAQVYFRRGAGGWTPVGLFR